MRRRERASSAPRATAAQRCAASLAVLALLLLAACAQPSASAGKKTTPTATTSSASRGYTPAPGSTASATTPPALPNSAFVCANPAGSSLTYAYVNADRQIYMVSGCSAPVQLTHLTRPDAYSQPNPVAWSPSRRYLAFRPNLEQDLCLKIIDTQTGDILPTRYDCFNGDPSSAGDLRSFIGWVDDNTFLGRIDVLTGSVPDPVRIMRVDVHSEAETPVTSYAWMSAPVLRAGYLFFAGRAQPNDTDASLYRLSLADGTQTRFVSLGISGNGGCQVGPGPCSWTAPWDVSPDGAHILYHNPGADSLPSDTHAPAPTPIYYANLDGSGAVQVLAGEVGQALSAPAFDPTGTRVMASVPGSNNNADFIYQPLPQGSVQRLVGSYNVIWRADGQALVDLKTSYSGDLSLSTPTLFTVSAQTSTPLALNTFSYLWAS